MLSTGMIGLSRQNLENGIASLKLILWGFKGI
jgi:hypothetical protein